MNNEPASAQIGQGRDPWGSRPAPLESPCDCVVQPTVQTEPHCTNSCTDSCTIERITLVAARGGSGTSTIAAVLGLIGATMVRTELLTPNPTSHAPSSVSLRPTRFRSRFFPGSASPRRPAAVPSSRSSTQHSTPIVSTPRADGERRIGVLRGPCYIALPTMQGADQGLDGIILVAEPGRALTERDVADVTGVDVVATVPVTPAVARTIDAGLLATRHLGLREFHDLPRWLAGHLDPFPTGQPHSGTPCTNPARNEWHRLAGCCDGRVLAAGLVVRVGPCWLVWLYRLVAFVASRWICRPTSGDR